MALFSSVLKVSSDASL